jgi:DNA adenine methylase
VGVEATTIKRIEKFAPRLAKVKVYGGDYEKVVRKYDSKDTVFFLDPPYHGYNVDVGETDFDEERFFKLLQALKGRFLITYGIRGKFPELVKGSDFWSKRIRTQLRRRTFGSSDTAVASRRGPRAAVRTE